MAIASRRLRFVSFMAVGPLNTCSRAGSSLLMMVAYTTSFGGVKPRSQEAARTATEVLHNNVPEHELWFRSQD
jgi:hypothetical protein